MSLFEDSSISNLIFDECNDSIFSSFDSDSWDSFLSPLSEEILPTTFPNTPSTNELDKSLCFESKIPEKQQVLTISDKSHQFYVKSKEEKLGSKVLSSHSISNPTALFRKKQLPVSEYTVNYVVSNKEFTNRIVIHFKSNGLVPFYCELCKKESFVLKKQSKIIVSCGHFVPCNECRGRSIRRILRCITCCTDISGSFPVCGDGNCIDLSDKEPVNAGCCPLCEKKLKKELCNDHCKRRRTQEYTLLRKQLNNLVVELVHNPNFGKYRTKIPGVWRPCPHYSFCPTHDVICKGHGKYSACEQCKEDLKNIGDSPPLKRLCTTSIKTE